MNVLLLGSGGQVGALLGAALAPFARVVSAPRATVDVGDFDAVRRAVRDARPDVVVNAAAYTDVDGAEKDPHAAARVNAGAVAVLGEECRTARAALIHYSTDFVFDGRASRPYVETDAPAPLGVYGGTKLGGEAALAAMDAPAIVLRTAWVYSPTRRSFVMSILRLARERETLKIVADQVGSPTYAGDLAAVTALLLYGVRADPYGAIDAARGVYHAAGSGVATRFELAQAVIAADPRAREHRVRTLEPVPTSAYPLPAARPAYAPLDCTKLRERFGLALPDWRESLVRALRA